MTVTRDAELRVGALEETVTVTGATPLVDVQLAATVQSIPGPVVSANVVYPSAVVAGTLSAAALG